MHVKLLKRARLFSEINLKLPCLDTQVMLVEDLAEPVEDVEPESIGSIDDLVNAYSRIHGFMAGHLWRALKVLEEGISECDRRFLAFTGNIVATGVRRILAWFIEKKLFNVVVTTCGTVDHDIARATGGAYLKGVFEADDTELHGRRIHRLGNIFIPWEDYGPKVEKFVKDLLLYMKQQFPDKRNWAPSELLSVAGSLINDKGSILSVAYSNNIPVFVPGITDGAFGSSLMFLSYIHNITVDVLADLRRLADLVFASNKTMALIIGGGISKHHTLWWNQFKEGLDYVVYITTALEYDGSLSGAHPREAVTWGKVSKSAKSVVVYSDATLVLPIMAAWLAARRGLIRAPS